jgi:hypothetical protein
MLSKCVFTARLGRLVFQATTRDEPLALTTTTMHQSLWTSNRDLSLDTGAACEDSYHVAEARRFCH